MGRRLFCFPIPGTTRRGTAVHASPQRRRSAGGFARRAMRGTSAAPLNGAAPGAACVAAHGASGKNAACISGAGDGAEAKLAHLICFDSALWGAFVGTRARDTVRDALHHGIQNHPSIPPSLQKRRSKTCSPDLFRFGIMGCLCWGSCARAKGGPFSGAVLAPRIALRSLRFAVRGRVRDVGWNRGRGRGLWRGREKKSCVGGWDVA